MATFSKLFVSMYDGTLATVGPWQALVTFQQMIVLGYPNGVVDMTAEAISRRTTIPLDVIQTGIEALQRPDPESRSPVSEGRRIVLLDPHRAWGWHVVNYEAYRKAQSDDDRREYMRVYMQNRRATKGKPESQPTTKENQGNALTSLALVSDVRTVRVRERVRGRTKPIAPTVLVSPASQETPEDVEISGEIPYRVPPCPYTEILRLYHETLPTWMHCEKLTDTRKTTIGARWKEVCAEGKFNRAEGLEFFKAFFERVTTSQWLMGKIPGLSGTPFTGGSLMFLMHPEKFAKVIEGFYHRGQK